MSITIIGTVAFDGIETPKGKYEKLLGGSATYAATAARIFADVHIVSIVGQDFTKEYFDYFLSRKIHIEGIKKSQNKTFFWSGFYEKDMNHAITRETQLNCLTEFDPVIPDSAKNSDMIFFANTDPDLQYKALTQFSNSKKFMVLDTMNFWIHHKLPSLQKMIKSTDVLIINNQELRDLTQKDGVVQGMKKLLSDGGPKILIVKKGEHGAMMYDGKEFFAIPALPIDNVVDPTGAGDSFAGGFVGYLATQEKITQHALRKAMAIGTIISSFTIQGFGTSRIEKLTLEEINRELEKLIQLSTIPSTNP